MSGERALSFGSVAEEYEATRPGWPREPFERVFEHFAVPSAPDVVDLAAGTGKLTRTLARLAGTLVAVEPDDALREVLQRELPQVTVLAGKAEAIPLESGTIDVLCAGQAFHWFDLDVAMPEIARVLRPGGIVIAGWNVPPKEGTWYDAVIDFLHLANPDHLPAGQRDWPEEFHDRPGFGAFFETQSPNAQPVERGAFTRLLATHSMINLLPPDQRASLIERAVAVADGAGAFDAEGHGAIPWRCELYALQRSP